MTFEVERGCAQRLDVLVASRLAPEYSRSQVARMMKAGLVMLNGEKARPAAAARAGDRVEIARPPAREPASNAPGATPALEVLYDDEEIIVVNKPAGLTVHPAPGTQGATLVDALLARFPELENMAEPDGLFRPGIVHRLDKDTSGVMVVARSPFARTALARQFKQRTVSKIYLALVRGLLSRERQTIARPIGRHPVDRKRMSVRSPGARDATSHLKVLARFDDREEPELCSTLVRIKPETGRTHQIRVHLASIGHPCLGDPVYGAGGVGRARSSASARGDCAGGPRPRRPLEAAGFTRQALHALALAIDQPRSGARLSFLAPLPEDMTAFLFARGIDTGPETLRVWVSGA